MRRIRSRLIHVSDFHARLACAWAVLLVAGCADWDPKAGQDGSVANDRPGGASAVNSPLAPGAPEPTPQEVARMLEPNVLGVSCFYSGLSPWMWNQDRTMVRGIKVGAVFLLGPNSTGVFGDGVIHPRLFAAYRDDQGQQHFQLVKEWTFSVDQAMPFRIKRRTRGGWGYTFFLPWGDLDLSGRDIRLTVSFERSDGMVISGSKKDFRVPKAGEQS